MERYGFAAMVLLENLLIGGIFLLYPKITRRGLLFGVYVGEEASAGPAAADIRSGWYRIMVALVTLCLFAGIAGAVLSPAAWLVLGSMFAQILGFFAAYLWAYRRARALAPERPTPVSAAPLAPPAPPHFALPAAVLAFAVGMGLFSLAFTWTHYDAMPARIPVHFGASGAPDGWATKSFGSVMTMPLTSILLGVLMGGSTFLTASAKRALRYPDGGASLEAQMRFRSAMTRFLAGVTVLTTVMITAISVGSVRVAVGEARGLGAWIMAVAIGLVVYALGGTIYIAIRYGQGGARLEGRGAAAPLTDGLADNRFWKLGLFYVNRDDPSWLVEHRFGLGYTLNFGNVKAVLVVIGVTAAMLAVAGWAIVASGR